MKVKKICRKIICLLLIAIMIIGTLPMTQITEVIAAALPTDDASWTLVGTDSKMSNLERYLELKDALEKPNHSDTAYIRLDRDIKLDADLKKTGDSFTEYTVTIKIYGNVVFDLNGHTLKAKIYKGTGEFLYPISLCMFEIKEGATFTIVDSKGKGKIATDSWISEPHVDLGAAGDINLFDMFKIRAGGEIIVNAPGAEFECGRSKQQWVTRAYTVDREPGGIPDASDFFTGNIRGQACGSVFVAGQNSKITIAGGKFLARGYQSVYDDGYGIPCAVFDISPNTVVNIIDGTFYGKGCANVFDAVESSKITIRSGVFDVFKVDKVPVLNDPYNPDRLHYYRYTRFTNGKYGEIGIPDSVLDPDNSDIIIGGHNYSEDEDPEENAASDTHKTVTIKPKTNSKTPDDQIMVESANSIGAWNGNGSYIINAKNGRAYFSDSESEYLENDLQDDTYHYYLWTFTLYDAETGKKCNADPIERATVQADRGVSIDASEFKVTNTSSSYRFDSDSISSYKIKAEVQEVWSGHHTYNTKFFNWFYFNEYNFIDVSGATGLFDFEVLPNARNSVCSSYTIHTDNEEGMEYYFEFLNEHPTGDVSCNSYYRYCTIDSAGKTVLSSKQEIATNVEYGDSIDFIVSPKHAGPVYVTVEYVFKGSKNSSSVTNTVTLTVTHLIYALNYMRYDIIKSDKVTKTSYVSASSSNYDTVELGEDEMIVIKPNVSADMTKMDVKDPLTGNTLDRSKIKWQFSVGLDDNGSHIWYDVPNNEIIDYDIDGVKFPCVNTNRTAWYRMSYEWNGQTYYSPQSLLVRGVSYESTRIPTAYLGDNYSNRYGKGNNVIILHLNEDADWYTGGCSISSIQISMVSMPTKASPATKLKILTGNNIVIDKNNNITVVNVDSFFTDASGAAEGEYKFRIKVIGENADGTSYSVTANCNYYYRQATTELNIYVDGTPVYEYDDNKVKIPYILPANANQFNFTYDFYPMYSNGTAIDLDSIKWESSDSEILRIDEKTGEAKAYTPGTVTIYCSWLDENNIRHSSSVKVSVPIAGFELYKLDYSEYVGKKLTDVINSIARIKSVWSYGGNKVTQNVYKYITAELTSWNGYTNGGTNFQNARVEYNNNYRYGYTFKSNVNGGYFFPVTVEKDSEEYPFNIEYYVDTSLLESNGLDNGDILPVEDYDATIEWNTPYRVHIDYSNKTYEEMYTDYMYIEMYHIPVIEDPDAFYLNEVNITVNKPAVGDNRYEGTTYNPMNEYMVLNISGLLGSRKASDSHSYVSKLDTSKMKGTGKTYDDASIEDSGALASEYMSVWNTTDYETWNKPTKLYETGIYVHDVELRFDPEGDGTDGLKIYVAKDANVYVNGNLIDYAGISYPTSGVSSGNSIVSFKYYFDVGRVAYTNVIEIRGIDAPLQGELPTGVDDYTITANGIETDDIYISKLIWFVDADKDGTYDEGEEAVPVFKTDGKYDKEKSTLWYDSRFLAGVSYSLYIELSTDTVRIDPDSLVWWYGNGINKSFRGITSLVYTFPADMYIRTISFNTATDANVDKNDPYGLQGDCHGFSFLFMYVNYAKGDDPTTANILGNGIIRGKNLPSGKVWLIPIIDLEDGYTFANDLQILVNGSKYCEEYVTGKYEIFVEKRSEEQVFGYYLFTVTSSGVKISGTVTSFGNSTDNVTITLSKYTGSSYQVRDTITVKGNSATYNFENVEAGEYLVQISKTKHATRTYEVVVGTSDVKQDALIWLYGDVTGDGLINATDATQVNRKYNGKASVFGSSDAKTEAYRLTVADVYSSDKTINATDATQIARSYNNKSSILDSMP